jgi:hypothetical protein
MAALDAVAFSNALRSAVSVEINDRFDSAVIAGIARKPNWRELLTAHLSIFAPAVACGVVMMLFVMQFALQTPTVDQTNTTSSQLRTVNVDKLMILIDRQKECVASNLLIEQCLEVDRPILQAVGKSEQLNGYQNPQSQTPVLS